MTRQYFADVTNEPVTSSFTAVNSHTTVALIFPISGNKMWTRIPANDMRAGKVYRVDAGGVMGATGTPTVAYTPFVGPAATTADSSLGISTTFTMGAPTAVAWYYTFTLLVRSVGNAASTAAVVGTGVMTLGQVAAASIGPAITVGGLTTVTTLDSSVDQFLSLGATWSASSASNTHTTQWVVMRSLN